MTRDAEMFLLGAFAGACSTIIIKCVVDHIQGTVYGRKESFELYYDEPESSDEAFLKPNSEWTPLSYYSNSNKAPDSKSVDESEHISGEDVQSNSSQKMIALESSQLIEYLNNEEYDAKDYTYFSEGSPRLMDNSDGSVYNPREIISGSCYTDVLAPAEKDEYYFADLAAHKLYIINVNQSDYLDYILDKYE